MARDTNIGYPRDETQSVVVNSEVITELKATVAQLEQVVEEQVKIQQALGIIVGQELDLEA